LVLEYFSGRPESFLEFDIEKDSPMKLVRFFDDLNLDAGHWGHHNRVDISKTDFSETESLSFNKG